MKKQKTTSGKIDNTSITLIEALASAVYINKEGIAYINIKQIKPEPGDKRAANDANISVIGCEQYLLSKIFSVDQNGNLSVNVGFEHNQIEK